MGINQEEAPLKSIFLLPGVSSEATEILFPRLAIQMALVEKESLGSLDPKWGSAGVYLLFDNDKSSKTRIYVGKSADGVSGRLKQHPRAGRDWWKRALLVIDSSDYGFSSAQVGWLESELTETMVGAPGVICDNKNQPADRSLPPYEQEELQPVVRAVLSVLRSLGINPDTPDQGEPSFGKMKKKANYRNVSVKDLLDSGIIKTGTTLYCMWANRSDKNETATVLKDGRIETMDGQKFDSLSSAASHLRGGAANGWSFWGIKSGLGEKRSMDELRSQLLLSEEDI